MQKRPSVGYLIKKYRNKDFFLSDLFGTRAPTLSDTPRNFRTIERLRKDGYVCVFSCNTWYIFY